MPDPAAPLTVATPPTVKRWLARYAFDRETLLREALRVRQGLRDHSTTVEIADDLSSIRVLDDATASFLADNAGYAIQAALQDFARRRGIRLERRARSHARRAA